MEYDLESGPWDPIARVVSSCLRMAGNMTKNLGDVPIGIGGCTYERINKELEKLFGSSIKGHISLARLAQGSKEFNDASNNEINDVVRAWEELVRRSDASKERECS